MRGQSRTPILLLCLPSPYRNENSPKDSHGTWGKTGCLSRPRASRSLSPPSLPSLLNPPYHSQSINHRSFYRLLGDISFHLQVLLQLLSMFLQTLPWPWQSSSLSSLRGQFKYSISRDTCPDTPSLNLSPHNFPALTPFTLHTVHNTI